jgi:hypothetical protein
LDNEINYNHTIILKWIDKFFPEIGNVAPQEFNTDIKRRNIITQCIKSFLNKHNPDCKFNINSKVTKTLYNKLSLHMKIDFVQNKDSDFRIYFLKALLICRGYDCDFNGVYNNSTMRIVKQYKFDNNIPFNKSPYEISPIVWYKLLTNKKLEEN